MEERKNLDHAEAGRAVNRAMAKQKDRFERRLESTKEDLMEAMEIKDKDNIELALKEQEKWESKLLDIQKGREELKTSMEELIRDKEQQHRREMKEFDVKLYRQQATTEKAVKELEESKNFMRDQQAREDEKAKAMTAELNTAKEEADRGDVEKLAVVYSAAQVY